jgi:hemoglobin
MRIVIASAACVLLGLVQPARADDKPLERAELDKRAARVAYEAALAGTEMFNKGDHAGCFRLYQGTLQALAPMLDHRPQLAAAVVEKLDKAKAMRPVDGAFVLREALDSIIGKSKPTKSLWDRLGGEQAVRTVVHEAGTAAAADPKVNFTRNGTVKIDEKGVARLEQLLVEFISEKTGGPLKYTGKDMKTAHAGMKITEDEFNALTEHILAALKKAKVLQPEIDELMEIVAATKKDIVEKK